MIAAERYSKGVGEGMTKASILKREIIHRLYISPLSHSEILKHLKVRMHMHEGGFDVCMKLHVVLFKF